MTQRKSVVLPFSFGYTLINVVLFPGFKLECANSIFLSDQTRDKKACQCKAAWVSCPLRISTEIIPKIPGESFGRRDSGAQRFAVLEADDGKEVYRLLLGDIIKFAQMGATCCVLGFILVATEVSLAIVTWKICYCTKTSYGTRALWNLTISSS